MLSSIDFNRYRDLRGRFIERCPLCIDPQKSGGYVE